MASDPTPPIIIGAGPAGLAVGACLARAGRPAMILEATDQVASAWRRHYSRLHLHTHRRHSALPFLPMPDHFPRYPSRAQVVEYLESYASHFGLAPRFNEPVLKARPDAGDWVVQTPHGTYRTAHLVVASGYAREPVRPSWPGQEDFRGRVVHSSAYRDGAPFRGQRVLVVGFGNSGGEIAIDLTEHGAIASLAVRGQVNVIPREILGIPILSIGIIQRLLSPRIADTLNAPLLRAIFGDLSRYGLRKAPYGPQVQIREHKRIPLIDVGTMRLIREGRITVYHGVTRFTSDGVVFDDGRSAPFDAVVLATGYRPRVTEFLEGTGTACDADGTPLTGEDATPIAGLHFCGFFVSPNGMLRSISREAPEIAAAITSSERSTSRPRGA